MTKELRRRRNSTGWVDGFPLGRGGLVKLGVQRMGVDDLRGCGGESCPVCSQSTQVRLRRDLLMWAAGVINPSVGVFSYYGIDNNLIIIIIIIIIIIMFINCDWVVTRWQWLFYMYTNMKKSN